MKCETCGHDHPKSIPSQKMYCPFVQGDNVSCDILVRVGVCTEECGYPSAPIPKGCPFRQDPIKGEVPDEVSRELGE